MVRPKSGSNPLADAQRESRDTGGEDQRNGDPDLEIAHVDVARGPA